MFSVLYAVSVSSSLYASYICGMFQSSGDPDKVTKEVPSCPPIVSIVNVIVQAKNSRSGFLFILEVHRIEPS